MEPILSSLGRYRPGKVFFAASQKSAQQIGDICTACDFVFDVETLVLEDEQDLARCVADLRGLCLRHPEWQDEAAAGNLLMDWDNGSGLNLLPDVDLFQVVGEGA